MKPVAYEGTEPYLFVSYAHRDAERVFEVLEELQERGYRLWYDDGIAPGSEWPEDIARHLDAAAVVIAFVTPNSMASRNCRREINFSLSKEKPFLSIVLEDTEMSLGMEMQLSAQQSIIRKNYDSWEGFIAKVLACPDLAPCRAVGEPEAALPVQPEEALPAQPIEVEVSVVPPAEDVAPQKPSRAARKRLASGSSDASGTQTPKPGRGRTIGLVAAAVALLVVAVLAFRMLTAPKATELSWGSEVTADDTSFFANDKTLTQADWEALCALEGLRTLSLKGCDLSSCDFAGAFEQGKLAGLRRLELDGSTGVKDWGFLAKFAPKDLSLAGCAGATDLSSLDATQLESLDVSGTGVADLAPLADAPLAKLAFADTQVADLAPLATMEKLSVVDGSRTQVSSLEPLAGLERLESIAFDGCTLSTLPKSLAALSLAKVHLAGTGVTKLGMLSNCTRLTELDLSGDKRLSDLSWLDAQNYETLTLVDLAQTQVAADDLAWIAQCAALKELRLDGIALTNLGLCDGLENLEALSAVGCGIEDITALSGCAKLEVAVLACNQIADAAPLAAMKRSHDTIMDLTNNKLTSVEGFASGDCRALMLFGNDPDIALTVPASLDSYVMVVPWSERLEEAPIATEGYHGRLYLVDCPENQRLRTEDLFKGMSVTFVTADELWELYANNDFGYTLDADYSYLLSLVRDEGLTYTSVFE